MNSKTAFAIIFTIISALMLYGCVNIDSPKITHNYTKIAPISLSELELTSSFDIKNPNPVGLKGIVNYDIYVKDTSYISGKTSDIDLAPNGSNKFYIKSKISLIKIFGASSILIETIQSGRQSIPYSIKGKYESDLAGIKVEAPIEVSGEIPLPKLTPQDLIKLLN